VRSARCGRAARYVNDTNVEARGSVGVAVEVVKATKKQETQPWLSVKVEQGTRQAVKWNYVISINCKYASY
jgi:hypothetical protein